MVVARTAILTPDLAKMASTVDQISVRMIKLLRMMAAVPIVHHTQDLHWIENSVLQTSVTLDKSAARMEHADTAIFTKCLIQV